MPGGVVSRMRHGRLADVHTRGHRAGAGLRPGAPELHELFAIDLTNLLPPKVVLERLKDCGLGTTRRPAYRLHVFDVQIDEIAEDREAGDLGCTRNFASVDLPFGIDAPGLGVLIPNERLARALAFAPDLNAPPTRISAFGWKPFLGCKKGAVRIRRGAKTVENGRRTVVRPCEPTA